MFITNCNVSGPLNGKFDSAFKCNPVNESRGRTVKFHVFCMTSVLVWTSAVSIMFSHFILRQTFPTPFGWDAGWTPHSMWTQQRRKETSLFTMRIELLASSLQPVNLLTEQKYVHLYFITHTFPEPGYFVLFASPIILNINDVGRSADITFGATVFQ